MEVFDLVYWFRLNIFTNKISDLLLLLENERAESRESYPHNDITNEYSMMLDWFTYFIVVVFPLLGTSEELIRDSKKVVIL